MSRILVTGGAGFIGNHIVRRLCAEGREVRALVRPSSRLDGLSPLPVEIVHGDLTDKASLVRAVQGCDTVFHVAADYRLWARHPEELYRNNVEGTENLLGAAFENGVSRFIYTSTVGTIGFHHDGSEAAEEDFPDPSQLAGPYKRSKFLAEQCALRYAKEGHAVVIVNPTAPVGERDWKPTDTGKVIVDFLNRKMPAYIDTGLNLVDVHDVAEGHLLAMTRGRTGERYILGGRNLSFHEILEMLAKQTGLPAPSVRVPYMVALCAGAVETFLSRFTGKAPRASLEAVRMARYKMYASSAKAERELGYRPGPVEPALERAIEWFRNSGMAAKA